MAIKKITLVASSVLTVLIILFAFYYTSSVNQRWSIEPVVDFEVKTGDTATSVIKRLTEQSIVDVDPYVAKLWLRLHYNQLPIKAGLYELSGRLTIEETLLLFQQGKQKQFAVALVEGLRWKEWLDTLKQQAFLVDDWSNETYAEILAELADKYGQPIASLEGVLLADTYFVTNNTAISDVVKRAADSMHKEVTESALSFPLFGVLSSPYDLLTLASIVEKETALASERPLIAGVFVNRLQNNMRLQTDPTVIYGLGEQFDGNITRKHLREHTAYNTYVIKGLPPTPIAMVGAAAIEAVIHSELTEYVYFVARGDGSHQFSETLEEHNKAVKKYQLRQ